MVFLDGLYRPSFTVISLGWRGTFRVGKGLKGMGCLGLTGLRTDDTLSSFLSLVLGLVGLTGLNAGVLSFLYSVGWVGLKTSLGLDLIEFVLSFLVLVLVGLAGLKMPMVSPFLYAVEWVGLDSSFFVTRRVGLGGLNAKTLFSFLYTHFVDCDGFWASTLDTD